MKKIVMSLAILSIVFVACGKTDKDNTKKLSEDVQVLCQYLGEKPENITISKNKTGRKDSKDDTVYASYTVKINGDEEKSGYYCISLYTKGEKRYTHIAKEVKISEREEKDIKWKKSTRLCYDLYEGPVDEVGKEKQEYIVPKIDKSQVKEYEVTRERYLTFTAGSGYFGEDNNYKVAYLGHPSANWKLKEYSENGWIKKQVKTSKDIPTTSPEVVHFGPDETLWYNDEKLLMVTDCEGNVLGKLDLVQWKEEKGKSEEEFAVSYLEDGKVIFSYITEKNEEKSMLVDVKTGDVEKEYDMSLEGETFGDKIVKYNQGTDCVEVINWETGTVLYKLDLNNIRLMFWDEEERVPLEGKYIAYSERGEEEIGFIDVYKEELKGYEKSMCEPMHFSMYNNRLYIIAESGAYRYEEENKTLFQIMDSLEGESLWYTNMVGTYGDGDVGENETIYFLSFREEWKDEFMYLEPKEKSE